MFVGVCLIVLYVSLTFVDCFCLFLYAFYVSECVGVCGVCVWGVWNFNIDINIPYSGLVWADNKK